jgi:hypothetical protein
MKFGSRTALIAARIEGSESTIYIKCDIDESRGIPYAVLWWPSTADNYHICRLLEQSDLMEDKTKQYTYIHTGKPIPIPKVLAEMNPAPLSDDAFRLGFFVLPER